MTQQGGVLNEEEWHALMRDDEEHDYQQHAGYVSPTFSPTSIGSDYGPEP